ncbi:MAG: endonuclease domain-containing protein [Nitrospirae bacterium]|nr:endonuclease domain-containing protein [Candidatus Troglogloeales bacterium]MBI3598496.1 endonuclease domain-containing protein [Candidatus Troglogloeales bacterium]
MAISISVPPDKGGKGGYIPYNQTLTKKAQENRKNPTSAEKKLWVSVLQDKQLADLKFTRQKPLDQYIVDFYCAERMLVIEIDGDTHTDQMDYDSQRTARLEDLGVKVIRYTNNDVLQNIEGVCSDLLEKLNAYGSPLTRGVRGVISPPTKVINPLNPPYQGESEA